jgi:hypothetical protein
MKMQSLPSCARRGTAAVICTLGQIPNARRGDQPGTQRVVADRIIEVREVHDERTAGLAAVADAGKDNGVTDVYGGPQSSLVVSDHARAPGRSLGGIASRLSRHWLLTLLRQRVPPAIERVKGKAPYIMVTRVWRGLVVGRDRRPARALLCPNPEKKTRGGQLAAPRCSPSSDKSSCPISLLRFRTLVRLLLEAARSPIRAERTPVL